MGFFVVVVCRIVVFIVGCLFWFSLVCLSFHRGTVPNPIGGYAESWRGSRADCESRVSKMQATRTTKRFPSPRCASAIQIVRPFESTVDRNRAGSRLLFLAEFLKTRIIPERIEHRIEPE